MAPLLSEVRGASLLNYTAAGSGKLAQRSRKVCYAIKVGAEWAITRVGERAAERAKTLRRYLDDDVVLIPAPRSSPINQGQLWPPMLICEALVENGLGAAVEPVLIRDVPVRKSAGSSNRPSADEHYDSMRVDRGLSAPGRIAVVDDVVTKGATLLAAASRVQQAYPDADVRVFAAVNTLYPGVALLRIPAVKLWRIKRLRLGGVSRE